jgi:YD repeat-containing protein
MNSPVDRENRLIRVEDGIGARVCYTYDRANRLVRKEVQLIRDYDGVEQAVCSRTIMMRKAFVMQSQKTAARRISYTGTACCQVNWMQTGTETSRKGDCIKEYKGDN